MDLEQLFKATRLQIGPTRRARLKEARLRSEEFNRRSEADLKAQRVSPELLRQVINL